MTWDRANHGRDELTDADREAFWNGEWLGNVQPSLEDVGAGEVFGEGSDPAPTVSDDVNHRAVSDLRRTVRTQAMRLAMEGVRVP
jgi:hypothetical protein